MGTDIYGHNGNSHLAWVEMLPFQMEVAAIEHCGDELLRREAATKTTTISSNSQAATKALRSYQVSCS